MIRNVEWREEEGSAVWGILMFDLVCSLCIDPLRGVKLVDEALTFL